MPGAGGGDQLRGTDIYTLLCVKYIASGNLLYGAGRLSLVLCGDLDGRVWGSGPRGRMGGQREVVHVHRR